MMSEAEPADVNLDQEHGLPAEHVAEDSTESAESELSAEKLSTHVAERFARLEALAGQVCVEANGSLVLAGVTIDRGRLSPELAQQISSVRERVRSLLHKTARTALKTAQVFVLSAGLLATFAAVNPEVPERFGERARAGHELVTQGITSEQRASAYKPGLSELLYRGISPVGYQESSSPFKGELSGLWSFLEEHGIRNVGAIQQLFPNLILGRDFRGQRLAEAKALIEQVGSLDLSDEERDRIPSLLDEYYARIDAAERAAWSDAEDPTAPPDPSQIPALNDAWRLYLGLAQQHDSFGVSDYKPAHETEDKYYYSLHGFWNALLGQDLYISPAAARTIGLAHLAREQQVEFAQLLRVESGVKGKVQLIQQFGQDGTIQLTQTFLGSSDDVMHRYSLGLGEDEQGSYLSYYDRWDLTPFLSQNVLCHGVGRPFEIYDRLYYDPVTFKVIQETPR